MSARRGRAQANGSDRINAHAAGRFLRAFCCPPDVPAYHPVVTPLLLAAVGVVALGAAGLILRTFGPRYRVARLIATTPKVSVAEANQLARAGRPAWVRVDGRIDSEDDFESPDHQ